MSLEAIDGVVELPVGYTVTFVPQIGRVEVTGADGHLVSEPGTIEPAVAELAADHLSSLVLTFGRPDSPVHLSAAEVLRHEDIDIQAAPLALACDALAGVLPREVFNYIGSANNPIAISLGSFSVAARRATPEELPEPEVLDPEAEIIRKDAEKRDLTTYDHAIVIADGTRYAIPFDTAEARLLARTIEAIATIRHEGADYVATRLIPPQVWRAMPFAERALFTTREKQIRSTSSKPIANQVDLLLARATNLMDITRRGSVANMTMVLPENLEVSYSLTPQSPDDTAINVITQDTPRAIAERVRSQPIPETDLATARLAIGYLGQTGTLRLGHQQAIDLVEFVMTREGKTALLAVITETGGRMTYATVHDGLHEIAHRSLGASYFPTRDAMVIRAGSWTSARHVRQVSGGLPGGTTRADLGFSKWVLYHPTGRPHPE